MGERKHAHNPSPNPPQESYTSGDCSMKNETLKTKQTGPHNRNRPWIHYILSK